MRITQQQTREISQMKIDALGVANVAQAMLPWKHALELLQKSPRRALPGATWGDRLEDW